MSARRALAPMLSLFWLSASVARAEASAALPLAAGVLANQETVWIAEPGGGIASLDTKNGAVRWRSRDADLPLASDGATLAARDARDDHALRLAALDARTGALLGRCEPVPLMETANTSGDVRPGRRLIVRVQLEAGARLRAWWYTESYEMDKGWENGHPVGYASDSGSGVCDPGSGTWIERAAEAPFGSLSIAPGAVTQLYFGDDSFVPGVARKDDVVTAQFFQSSAGFGLEIAQWAPGGLAPQKIASSLLPDLFTAADATAGVEASVAADGSGGAVNVRGRARTFALDGAPLGELPATLPFGGWLVAGAEGRASGIAVITAGEELSPAGGPPSRFVAGVGPGAVVWRQASRLTEGP